MFAALQLAERGLGRVAPNPAVGCVIARGARVVGRGWTQPGGRPHAETEALARAGEAARGATAYVTLEPCSHHGRAPPCAEALIAAGIARCCVALEDPDGRVAGRGAEMLRAAGVEVDIGLCGEAAAAVNAGYLMRQRNGRPLVTLKLATTLDGRIGTKTGDSQWITGASARRRAHLLRAMHDAVLVGSGTATSDNPRLDVRLPGMAAWHPLRIVVDGRLRLPLTHDLVSRAETVPTLLFTHTAVEPARRDAFAAAGVEVLSVEEEDDGHLSLAAVLQVLGARGLTRLLVEGGGQIAAALLRAGLVDRLVWFQGPRLVGGDGVPAVAGFGVEALAEAPAFALVDERRVGEDLMTTYERRG